MPRTNRNVRRGQGKSGDDIRRKVLLTSLRSERTVTEAGDASNTNGGTLTVEGSDV